MSKPAQPAMQREHEGRVARSFLKLGAGELGARLIGFGATVYLARTLGVDAYGAIGFAFALMLYAAAVVDLGLEQLGPREIADRHAPLDTLVPSLLLARISASLVLSAILAVAGLFFLTRPEGPVLALFGLTLIAAGANAKWVYVGLEQTGIVSTARIVAELTKVAAIVALVHGPEDVLLAPFAYVAGDAIGSLLLLTGLRTAGIPFRLRWDSAVVRSVLHRALPLLLTSICGLLLYNADVVMLRIFRSRSEVGLYLVAYLLLNFIGVLGTAMTLSLIPALRRLEGSIRSSVYHSSFARAITTGLPIAVGGAVLAPQILGLVFGQEYHPSVGALRILIWTFPLFLMRSVDQAALIAAGRQDRVLHTTAAAAAVNVSLNLIVIPVFGMTGAAVMTVCAEVIRLGLARRYATREAYSLLSAGRMWRPALAAGVMAGVLLLVAPSLAPVGIAIGGVVYFGVLALTGVIGWENARPVLRL